jgi:hypothetical protein
LSRGVDEDGRRFVEIGMGGMTAIDAERADVTRTDVFEALGDTHPYLWRPKTRYTMMNWS